MGHHVPRGYCRLSIRLLILLNYLTGFRAGLASTNVNHVNAGDKHNGLTYVSVPNMLRPIASRCSLQVARSVLSSSTGRIYGSSRLLSTTPAKTSPSTSTYANQSKIPRLPIPDLEKSMDTYVKSLVPLLEEKVISVYAMKLTVSIPAVTCKRRLRNERYSQGISLLPMVLDEPYTSD